APGQRPLRPAAGVHPGSPCRRHDGPAPQRPLPRAEAGGTGGGLTGAGNAADRTDTQQKGHHHMLTKAPFHVPPGFLLAFGYREGRRFVALYWEPSGDEACYDDGISSAVGMSDNWLYLAFIRRPEVRRWLDEQGLNLGSSDEPAEHWLIADAVTGDLYAAPRREAGQIVRQQQLPEEG